LISRCADHLKHRSSLRCGPAGWRSPAMTGSVAQVGLSIRSVSDTVYGRALQSRLPTDPQPPFLFTATRSSSFTTQGSGASPFQHAMQQAVILFRASSGYSTPTKQFPPPPERRWKQDNDNRSRAQAIPHRTTKAGLPLFSLSAQLGSHSATDQCNRKLFDHAS